MQKCRRGLLAAPRTFWRASSAKFGLDSRLVANRAKVETMGDEHALEALRRLVRAKDLKNSTVRELIARCALAYDGHFTIEDLAQMLRANGLRSAHPATVYRSIPLLLEAGLIQLAPAGPGETQRYERSFGRSHHDHLVCTRCGSLIEFHSPTLEMLQDEIAQRYGFVLESHVHELRGVCLNCQKARPPHAGRKSGTDPH
jgi:Fur family transcriptional regulator, ferric uptake regulator